MKIFKRYGGHGPLAPPSSAYDDHQCALDYISQPYGNESVTRNIHSRKIFVFRSLSTELIP